MNRNQAFGMNNSLSSNIFNGTGKLILELVSPIQKYGRSLKYKAIQHPGLKLLQDFFLCLNLRIEFSENLTGIGFNSIQ